MANLTKILVISAGVFLGLYLRDKYEAKMAVATTQEV